MDLRRPQSNETPWSVSDFVTCVFRLAFPLTLIAYSNLPLAAAQEPPEENIYAEMSLAELGRLPVRGATLTETSRNKVPAAVTRITRRMIQESGARSLFELMEIYVPNFQWLRHHLETSHFGLRGIINDRDDKYLLRVNGRVLNERSQIGALSERDLTMLGDIDYIEVTRGPGSAVHGPGAVAMVVDIYTLNANTFNGTEVKTTLGAVEEFQAAEMLHGKRFENGLGMFLYGGIANYPGAPQSESPQVIGRTFETIDGQYQVDAGQPVPYDIGRDGKSYRDLPKLKLHAQLDYEDLEIWTRYTRGGEQLDWYTQQVAAPPIGPEMDPVPQLDDYQRNEAGYQQFSFNIHHEQVITSELEHELLLGYTMTDYERQLYQIAVPGFAPEAQLAVIAAHREDEYLGRSIFRWTPSDKHETAFGFEYAHNEFGYPSPGYPAEGATSPRFPEGMPRWGTDTYSGLAEHQWRILQRWTLFSSLRYDKHPYTEGLWSPRCALVFSPTDYDTIKLIYNHSVRRNFDEELRRDFENSAKPGDSESIDGLELRYGRNISDSWGVAVSSFLYDAELVVRSNQVFRHLQLGRYQIGGLELESVYVRPHYELRFSHSFTKLLHAFLDDKTQQTTVTGAVYGFGNDLANWSTHLSKIRAAYLLNSRWQADSSLIVYWGYPGASDYADYLNSLRAPQAALTDNGYDEASELSAYLSAGLQYRIHQTLTLRLDGYNLLGIFEDSLNKRLFVNRTYEYRAHAPSAAVSLRWSF